MVLAIAVYAIPAYGGCDRGSWALCGFRIGIDDVEFALLIGDDPKIAAAVDGDTVRSVDTGRQDRRCCPAGVETDPFRLNETGTLTIE